MINSIYKFNLYFIVFNIILLFDKLYTILMTLLLYSIIRYKPTPYVYIR